MHGTTCGGSLRQLEDKDALRCHTCARIVTVSRLEDYVWWVSGRKRTQQCGGAQFVEKSKIGKQPNRLLVVQAGDSSVARPRYSKHMRYLKAFVET